MLTTPNKKKLMKKLSLFNKDGQTNQTRKKYMNNRIQEVKRMKVEHYMLCQEDTFALPTKTN